MGKIGQNPKIWQLWRPVAPQPYVVQKSRPTSETPWPLAVYLCSASRDLYLALSEVPVWQIVDFRFWGQMTPKVKIFENVFRSHRRDTEIRFVAKFVKNWPLRSCRQVVSITTQKKTCILRDSSQPPFCPKWTNCAQNPECSHPLRYPCIPNLVRIGCVLPDLFWKDWFFGPKSQYNIGFQPTIKKDCTICSRLSTKIVSNKQFTQLHCILDLWMPATHYLKKN